MFGRLRFPVGTAQYGQHMAGAPLFHRSGNGIDIQSAKLQKTAAGKGQSFRRHVVDIAHQLHDFIFRRFSVPSSIRFLTKKNTHTVRSVLKCLDADADSCILQRHYGHGTERIRKMCQQSRSGGSAQFTLYLSSINRYAGQQICCSRRRHRHHSV